MTVFYTLDADGDRIPERADICKAASKQEALAAMRRRYEGADFEVVDLEPGRFGDCWLKVYDRKTLDLKERDWADEAGALMVQAPGEHPGGQAYWVTPCADVFVPVLRELCD